MRELYYRQKKPSGDVRKFLQERVDKNKPGFTELTAKEKKQLAKTEEKYGMFVARENVQNR